MFGFLKTPETKVGFLVSTVTVLVAAFSMKVSQDPSFLGRSKKVYFRIADASGLIHNGSVKMAGINVGVIREIKFDRGMARLLLIINGDVPVTISSSVEIRPNGILGDKYVEIVPGLPDDPIVEDGGELTIVSNKASLDALIKEVSGVAESVSDIANHLKAAIKDGGENSGPLGRIVHNIEKVTQDLKEFTAGKKEKIGEIVDNVHSITQTLDHTINDEGDEGFKANWRRLSDSMKKIDRSMANIEQITDKVNSGKGTLGRLVNDEKTVEELNTAIQGVTSFMGGANKMQTSLDFHSEYLMEQSLAKTYLGVRLQPGLDRYYELAIVDDPKGVIETTDIANTTNPGGPGETTSKLREKKTFKNKLKFNALFAKNFYNFTIKGGLIESTGGVGFDYLLLRRKLKLSIDAFDFSNTAPHLRGYARYNFYKGIYVIGGADDVASKTGTYSSFFGVGLDLTNDDLKTLVGKVSF